MPEVSFDYGFVKHNTDANFLTVLVGRLYPSRAVFATPCPAKGPDAHTTARLASFFRACGVQQMTYLCDQEGAIRTCMQEALEVAKARKWLDSLTVAPLPTALPLPCLADGIAVDHTGVNGSDTVPSCEPYEASHANARCNRGFKLASPRSS